VEVRELPKGSAASSVLAVAGSGVWSRSRRGLF